VQIAVPRTGSLHGFNFTDADYETHTLIPDDHNPSTFTTFNGKVCNVNLTDTASLSHCKHGLIHCTAEFIDGWSSILSTHLLMLLLMAYISTEPHAVFLFCNFTFEINIYFAPK